MNCSKKENLFHWCKTGEIKSEKQNSKKRQRYRTRKRGGRQKHAEREPERASSAPVGYPIWVLSLWVKRKPSKLEVWGPKSRFNLQPFPTAFQGLPNIYLFWINVINPPFPPVSHRRSGPQWKDYKTSASQTCSPGRPSTVARRWFHISGIIFCFGLTCKSLSDSSHETHQQTLYSPCAICTCVERVGFSVTLEPLVRVHAYFLCCFFVCDTD